MGRSLYQQPITCALWTCRIIAQSCCSTSARTQVAFFNRATYMVSSKASGNVHSRLQRHRLGCTVKTASFWVFTVEKKTFKTTICITVCVIWFSFVAHLNGDHYFIIMNILYFFLSGCHVKVWVWLHSFQQRPGLRGNLNFTSALWKQAVSAQ